MLATADCWSWRVDQWECKGGGVIKRALLFFFFFIPVSKANKVIKNKLHCLINTRLLDNCVISGIRGVLHLIWLEFGGLCSDWCVLIQFLYTELVNFSMWGHSSRWEIWICWIWPMFCYMSRRFEHEDKYWQRGRG